MAEVTMARVKKFILPAAGVVVLAVIATIVFGKVPSPQTSTAVIGGQRDVPLTSRGYTDALAGTAVIAGDPGGGSNLLELRVKEGQKVKRDEIIGVLSNYPKAEEDLRKAEANLTTLKQQHDTVLTGTRVTNMALQEATLESSIASDKLQTLQRARSGKPPEEKALEARLAEQRLEREKVSLALEKQALKNDLAQYEIDLASTQARIAIARRNCEVALVRSPLDGVVVQIATRPGERISGAGIAKVVDMSQLRVLADVFEDQVARLAQGGKVEITLRGNPTVYNGTIVRVGSTVNRMQRVEPDGAASTDARVVQIEIQFDDPSSVPPVLGRETRVTYR
jgi:HlyD family secretion protein